tara:strand:+ start:12103 stop:12345 length:243 start_codon:yes stop_codon:yes gene_type:complete
MKKGDLVKCMGASDLKFVNGIILAAYEGAAAFGMDLFQVMTTSGEIKTYTSAAVRPFDFDTDIPSHSNRARPKSIKKNYN